VSSFVPLLIGAVVALVVAVYAAWINLDRDRAFYPTVLTVVASYYVLFSVMAGGTRTMMSELAIMFIFVVAASVGFRRNLWLVVIALAGHGLLDTFHGSLVHNPGVPPWWPPFCASYDVAAAGFLAIILLRAPTLSKPRTGPSPSP
jgi:hypothetical protein